MDQATPSNLPEDRVEQVPQPQEPPVNGLVHKAADEGGVEGPLETVGLTPATTAPRIPLDADTNTTATLSREQDNYVLRTTPEVPTKNEVPDPATEPPAESNSSQNGPVNQEEPKTDDTPESKPTVGDAPQTDAPPPETQSVPELPPKLSERTVSLNGSDSIPSVPPTPPIRPSAVRPEPLRDSLSIASDAGTRSSTPEPRTSTNRPRLPLSQLPTHKRSLTASKGNAVSAVLISTALETIANSREAKRSTPFKESVQRALDLVRSGEGGGRPREIFEPLRLACETKNEKLMIASLDCISKLISHSFFVEEDSPRPNFTSPPPSPGGPNSRQSGPAQGSHEHSLVDIVVHTITSCHTESTPETVSLQIVKALLALVLSTTILVHQSSLLKAVRTVYNIFLLSVDPVNQMVAQGGLTQIVNHVFARCRIDPSLPTFPETGSSTPKNEPTLSPASSRQQTPPTVTSPIPPSPAPESQPLSRTESAEGAETGETKEPAPAPCVSSMVVTTMLTHIRTVMARIPGKAESTTLLTPRRHTSSRLTTFLSRMPSWYSAHCANSL